MIASDATGKPSLRRTPIRQKKKLRRDKKSHQLYRILYVNVFNIITTASRNRE
jgi:hypothetical protein